MGGVYSLDEMTTRAQLLRQLADLPDEDIQALLAIATRLRAKHLTPTPPEPPAALPVGRLHPERFGSLAGSVRFSEDVESPAADPDLWTCDAKNLGA